jgi:hypothetical protein
MFHTFQTTTTAEAKEASRRTSTRNACVECRRRKIRCDGRTPCIQCKRYEQPQLCVYTAPVQRRLPSRKAVRELEAQLHQYQSIFSSLFPGRNLDDLAADHRDDFAHSQSLSHVRRNRADEPSSVGTPSHAQDTSSDDEAAYLEVLEQPPEPQTQLDEAQRHSDKVNCISDDVNSLSLRVDKPSSYVGISSISTALKVIFRATPAARTYVLQSYAETGLQTRSNSPPPLLEDLDPSRLPPHDIGQQLAESYFQRVHPLMPMVEEELFWSVFQNGSRQDGPWLALLNTIFALGSLASSTCDNKEHYTYYQRARKHIGLESFGSNNLFMLQALALLSGYYLHWLNRPNEANSLLGATIRMAIAMGLHREYHTANPHHGTQGSETSANIRRRTWWSLFCLDVWASTSAGRPSLGRGGPGVSVDSPKISVRNGAAVEVESLKLLPIIHNVDFCKLATRVLDMLASKSLPRCEEVFILDAQLVEWHSALPPLLRIQVDEFDGYISDFSLHMTTENVAGVPDLLKTPRAIMLWRYQNLRMLMYRPFLIYDMLRKSDVSSKSKWEQLAIERCRGVAGQTIAAIDATCGDELIARWNAVWMMYQAVMVPLLSLFSRASSIGYSEHESPTVSEETAKWRNEVHTALKFFEKMRDSSAAAARSKDVVERLYGATEYVQECVARQSSSQQQSGHEGDLGKHSGPHDATIFPLETEGSMGLKYSTVEHGQLDDNGMDILWDDMLWNTWPEASELFEGLDQLDWNRWTPPNLPDGSQTFW